jgi:menaquinone-dependent protoporphyrinogen oxidase
MSGKILVAYATRYGSTMEVAEAIGDELRKAGMEVDVISVAKVKNLAEYRAAVIGSPIYMGKWLADAQVFVERHQAILRTMPIAYFTVGLSPQEGTEEQRTQAAASMQQVKELVPPVTTGLFTGKLNRRSLSFADQAIVTIVRAREGDFRDWNAIRSWARDLKKSIA